jgi:hypothetical protein
MEPSYFILRSLTKQAGHFRLSLVSVSETTTMAVPQHGQLGCRFCSSNLYQLPGMPRRSYLLANASISTRTSSLANPVTSVALAGLCLPKNFA